MWDILTSAGITILVSLFIGYYRAWMRATDRLDEARGEIRGLWNYRDELIKRLEEKDEELEKLDSKLMGLRSTNGMLSDDKEALLSENRTYLEKITHLQGQLEKERDSGYKTEKWKDEQLIRILDEYEKYALLEESQGPACTELVPYPSYHESYSFETKYRVTHEQGEGCL